MQGILESSIRENLSQCGVDLTETGDVVPVPAGVASATDAALGVPAAMHDAVLDAGNQHGDSHHLEELHSAELDSNGDSHGQLPLHHLLLHSVRSLLRFSNISGETSLLRGSDPHLC